LMIKLFLFASLFLLFYSLTVGSFPDTYRLRDMASRYFVPAACALLVFLLTSVLFKTPAAGLVWAVLGWFLPGFAGRAVKNRRRKKMKELAKNFIASSAGLYAAGQTTSEVLRVAAENTQEPLRSEFRDMIAKRNLNPQTSFPRLFEGLAEKYGVSEFRAVAAILSASERAGGPYAASKGLKRLGNALRQRDRLAAERAKAIMEPKIAAYVVILFLTAGLLADALFLSKMFQDTAGKMVLFISSVITAGLIVMAVKVMGTQADLD